MSNEILDMEKKSINRFFEANRIKTETHIIILRKDLFGIHAVHKNKIKIINIPEKTQLVEKGYDTNGNKIYAFHIYDEQKLKIYTTSQIIPDMLIIPISTI